MDPRRNPFPGMNPYAQPHWSSMAKPLSVYIADEVAEQLPSHLATQVGQRTFEETFRGISGPETEWYVTIVDFRAPEEPLVTVVNLVTAADRAAGPGRDAYVRHRDEVVASDTNLVEVDLVRGGEPITLGAVSPPLPACAYNVSARRAGPAAIVEYWPIGLRQRLPKVLVPIARGEPDVMLDIRSLVDRAYTTGRYYDRLDYTRSPDPPLGSEDAAWARGILRDAGLL